MESRRSLRQTNDDSLICSVDYHYLTPCYCVLVICDSLLAIFVSSNGLIKFSFYISTKLSNLTLREFVFFVNIFKLVNGNDLKKITCLQLVTRVTSILVNPACRPRMFVLRMRSGR